MKSTAVAAAPKLPDVRSCCVNAGINHNECIDKLCDPTKTFEIDVSSCVCSFIAIKICYGHYVVGFYICNRCIQFFIGSSENKLVSLV